MALRLILFPKGPKMFIENCFQPAFLENMRALAVQIGRSFPGVTGKPVHTYLLWFAAHAVPSSTCKIVVSQPKLASELASTASVGWLLRESGSGASTASKIMHAVRFSMLESRIKASNYFPSAKSDLMQLSSSQSVLEAQAGLYSFQLNVKSGHAVPLQNC
jgi:hypothetical protein